MNTFVMALKMNYENTFIEHIVSKITRKWTVNYQIVIIKHKRYIRVSPLVLDIIKNKVQTQ